MANLRRWSSSASGNASVAGGANTINFAEGQTPGSVNNSARELMAQLRGVYTPSDWGWVEHSATASVASQTSFKVAGDSTSDWTAGRRWRLKSGSTTRYGSVVSSSYTTETTVTVRVDSGSLSASHSLAAVSPIDASSNQLPMVTQSFLRNRIINGDMRIDQRNAGASVTPTATSTYITDRWAAILSVASKFSVQQNAGSVTPPAGYTNYLGVTSLSAYTVGTTESFGVAQSIEGFNAADLSWGNSNAQSVTLSFWVRSSLTGTFGGSIRNSAADRSYPFVYTINSANTWEYKTVVITGDTTGTWLTTNGIGLILLFSLGSGATRSGTAGTWAAANYTNATSATSVVGTNAATWYITGVQLEAGSVATPFERRQYGQELALCQRYYQRMTSTGNTAFGLSNAGSSTQVNARIPIPVTMRIAPTALEQTGTASDYAVGTIACSAVPVFASAENYLITITFTVASGLTATSAYPVNAASSGKYLGWSAEL